jgi:probable HAF family extracellular repeat protein
MHNKHRLALCALLILLVATLANAQIYTITDLGPLSPTAINLWGQVVGNYNGHAFMWTKTLGMQHLGIISGGTFSTAAAINDLGAVTGTADGPGTIITVYPNGYYCDDLVQPFVWTRRNGMQGLGAENRDTTYPPFGPCDIVPFTATGINALGRVVGYTGHVSSFQWALSWRSAGGMIVFGGNYPPTYANSVSNTDKIVGQSAGNPLCIGRAAWWKNPTDSDTSSGVDLGTLGSSSDVDFSSSANGVNDLGKVVGWSTTGPIRNDPPLTSPVHAVLWTQGGVITDLGTLAGDTSSAATRINFFGQVIGSSGDTVYSAPDCTAGEPGPFEVIGRPFIWSKRSGMQDLNTLISANSGWVLNSATGINIWGQIVGSGTLEGQIHGFLLTPKKVLRSRNG